MIEVSDNIYTAAQVRTLDRSAIAVYGIPGYELMCRAGGVALAVLRRLWPDAADVTIFCGVGNNAGDGYVLARLAMGAGCRVRVFALAGAAQLGGDAQRAFREFEQAGGRAAPFATGSRVVGDVVVDALLGIGLDRAIEGQFAQAVRAINESAAPVLALDIPTGLHADSGRVLGCAVAATATVSFVGLKQGLFLGEGIELRGRLEHADLDIPRQAYADVMPSLRRLQRSCLAQALPPRARTAHKGRHGRLLLVGGAPGMSGAIRLAAEAALRAGAGLVRVATHSESVAAVTSGRPEIMCHAVTEAEALADLASQCDAIVLGPGLGGSEWAQALWNAALSACLPTVLDADGLNLLAVGPQHRADWILTPHPGEAGGLLERPVVEIQGDRLAAVRALAARFGGIAVLKGAGTLIAGADEGPVSVCDLGNPGMATAGTGDVLAGIIGSLLVQGVEPRLAAEAGVYLHAAAGDEAAAAGERGMLAGDLLTRIRQWANPT